MARIDTATTERFIIHDLPAMAAATQTDSISAYQEYLERVARVVGGESESTFDWQAAFEAADENNGGPSKRQIIAATAARTAILIPDPMGSDKFEELRLHGDGGSFMTISRQGKILAAANEPSPEVPSEYGPPDKYVLGKLGAAIVIDKLCHVPADYGEGYRILTALHRGLGLLVPGQSLHIGSATLYEPSYGARVNYDRKPALAYSSVSRRILTPQARLYLATLDPEIAARMVGDEPHPDDLAGLLDSLSGLVANRTAIRGHADGSHRIEFPDPNHPDMVGVDWN